MKKFFKKFNKNLSARLRGINKIWLALFLPLTIASFILGGAKPMWCLATGLGAIYLIWQLFTPEIER